ncbi:DsbA family protein [Candidatus Pacearchaeota archaeon]|nr:DsbA family protein [Candidatus Pacearchaeota archaeon]
MSEGTITIKKDSLWKYSTFILGALLIVGAFVFFSGDRGSPTGNVVNTGTQQLPSQPSRSQISEDDDPVLGDKNAPVTIIEFSDYQCPFCRQFWTDTLPTLKEEYIDTGKVKLVYRDFPLSSIHPAATPAAEAANCAREIGGDVAYYKYHDKIFEEQNILDSGSPQGPVTKTVQFGEVQLEQWASELGYNIEECLGSGKYVDEIQNDFADGGSLGTPTFFINGNQLRGAQPFSAFKQVIDAELA